MNNSHTKLKAYAPELEDLLQVNRDLGSGRLVWGLLDTRDAPDI